jgi:hypothetical protein
VKLLLDEMYSPEIGENLRDLGYDVISAHERDDLAATDDQEIFRLMQHEERVIVTNKRQIAAPHQANDPCDGRTSRRTAQAAPRYRSAPNSHRMARSAPLDQTRVTPSSPRWRCAGARLPA